MISNNNMLNNNLGEGSTNSSNATSTSRVANKPPTSTANVGGATGAVVQTSDLQLQQQQQQQRSSARTSANTSILGSPLLPGSPSIVGKKNWSEYSLQQRHYLLEMEARYFMIDELLMKLSKHRMRWFQAGRSDLTKRKVLCNNSNYRCLWIRLWRLQRIG